MESYSAIKRKKQNNMDKSRNHNTMKKSYKRCCIITYINVKKTGKTNLG